MRLHHALELPAGHGHAQGRPGDRRGLHDGGQAGQADAALDARDGADPRGGRPARRRAERHHGAVLGQRHGAAHQGPAHAQAVVHGLDRGRPQAHRAVGRADPAGLDGAGRQRAVPDLRRRGPRRGRRGGDDRQDAQHRRGVHERQPLPRRRRRGGGLRRAPGAADGRPEDRPRHRPGREGRPADRRRPARQGRRPGGGRGRQGGEGARRRRARRRPRLLLQADGAGGRPRGRAPAARGDLRPGGPGPRIRRRGRGDRGGQRDGVRPRGLRLHAATSSARSG